MSEKDLYEICSRCTGAGCNLCQESGKRLTPLGTAIRRMVVEQFIPVKRDLETIVQRDKITQGECEFDIPGQILGLRQSLGRALAEFRDVPTKEKVDSIAVALHAAKQRIDQITGERKGGELVQVQVDSTQDYRISKLETKNRRLEKQVKVLFDLFYQWGIEG